MEGVRDRVITLFPLLLNIILYYNKFTNNLSIITRYFVKKCKNVKIWLS